jgi:hypothetical protein
MSPFAAPLPIDDVLGALRSALAEHSSAVLVAPPGAGKTTRAPLALLDETWAKDKRLILLEPRRIAAPRRRSTHGRGAFWRPFFTSTSAPCRAPPSPSRVDTPGAPRCA